jgi:hypothetical protein
MIKLYFDIYFEFLKNSRFFWKSVYIHLPIKKKKKPEESTPIPSAENLL